MVGRTWEEFEVGQTFTTQERTITEADVQAFADLSKDYHPLHLDEAYAKTTAFGRRIAHGMLGLAMADGLSQALGLTSGTFIAFLGLEWKFLLPIYLGDTVHEEQTVSSRRETKDPGRGILIMECRLKNQRGEVVQQGKRTMMIARRPAPGPEK